MNVPITRGTGGLRTESDPARSAYNAKYGGLRDLSACMDVDISDAGRPSRRKGMLRLFTDDPHSLFPVGDDYVLFGQDDGLFWTSDLSTKTGIRNVTPNAKFSYALVDNRAYYVNGFEKGYVEDRVSNPWVFDPAAYVGRNLTRKFYSPPVGQFVGYYNGRMYVVVGKNAYYSEPYGPDLFSMGDSFLMFESTGRMFRPVAGGIYVSDEHDTWFLSGSGPEDFNWRKVDNVPALPYSDAEATGQMVVTQDGDYSFIPGKVQTAFWMTKQGVVFGGPTGEIEKITDAKIDLPGVYSSGAVLVNGSTLIGVAL